MYEEKPGRRVLDNGKKILKNRIKVTRNAGYLDYFLAKLRCQQANCLIEPQHREGRILDVGCGTYPFFLLNSKFAYKFGLDQVVDSQSHAQWEQDRIFFKNYNLEKDRAMPFEDGYFDVITMLAVFEHVEPEKLVLQLKEIRRILKNDGVFVMTTPAGWTAGILTAMAAFRLISTIEIEEHKDAYTPAKILTLYQKAGFSKEKIKIGYFEMFMNTWVTVRK